MNVILNTISLEDKTIESTLIGDKVPLQNSYPMMNHMTESNSKTVMWNSSSSIFFNKAPISSEGMQKKKKKKPYRVVDLIGEILILFFCPTRLCEIFFGKYSVLVLDTGYFRCLY